MPHFCSCGADKYICQKCGSDLCSQCFPPVWRPDITGHKSAGNVCPVCLKAHTKETIKETVVMLGFILLFFVMPFLAS